MNLPLTSLIGLGLTAISLLSLSLFEFEGKIFGLFGVYAGGALLMIRLSTGAVILSFLLAGFSNCILLSSGHDGFWRLPAFPERSAKSLYRVVLWLIQILISYAAEMRVRGWIPLPDSILLAVLMMFLNGIINLTLEHDLLQSFIYLQYVFFAFELLYLLLDGSVLIFLCLTGISLLLSLTAAYMTVKEKVQEPEENIL